MTPDTQLEADLRALGAALRPPTDFAERVTDRVAFLPQPRTRRRRLLVPALAAAALVGVVTAGAVVIRSLPPPPVPEERALHLARPAVPPVADHVGVVTDDVLGIPDTAAPPPVVAFSFLDFAYINSKWGFIDRAGKVVVPARFSRVGEFSDGLAPVKVGGTHAAGGKWGYIDRAGKEVVAPRFDWARPFREGRAGVQVGDKWGFIDTTGVLVIAPRFESVERFSEGLAAVQEDKKWGFVGPDGAFRIRPRYHRAVGFSEGLAAVCVNAQSPLQYIDRTGATVLTLDPNIDYASSFHEERAGVTRGGKWGAIDRTGKLVVEPRYDHFEAFESGRARVSVRRSVEIDGVVRTAGTASGFIAADGTELGRLVPDYDNGVEIDPATGALTAVELDALLEPVRVSTIDFARLRSEGGLYRVWAPQRLGNTTYHTVGFVDRTGKVVIPPTLEDVGDFREGLAPYAVGLDWAAVEAAARRSR
jgi:hypothetical protein